MMLMKAEFANFFGKLLGNIKNFASSEQGSSAILIVIIIILTAYIIYMINSEDVN